MDSNTLVAVVPVAGSILTAALSYLFARRQQLSAQWRESKLNHYKVLLAGISDLAIDGADVEAHKRFASAVNTIALVAPQRVVLALLAFHDEIRMSNADRTREEHDRLLTKLVVEIRLDLGVNPKDNIRSFRYHLVGTPPVRSGKSA